MPDEMLSRAGTPVPVAKGGGPVGVAEAEDEAPGGVIPTWEVGAPDAGGDAAGVDAGGGAGWEGEGEEDGGAGA